MNSSGPRVKFVGGGGARKSSFALSRNDRSASDDGIPEELPGDTVKESKWSQMYLTSYLVDRKGKTVAYKEQVIHLSGTIVTRDSRRFMDLFEEPVGRSCTRRRGWSIHDGHYGQPQLRGV